MSSYVPAALRRLVAARASGVCEYCLIHQDDTFFGCQIEHIISEKHGGLTVDSNLAYACAFCNMHKGTDIASLSARTGQLVRLYNPRTDRWAAHFRLNSDGATIGSIADVGEVTIKLLDLNHADRLLERRALVKVGRYPTYDALKLML